MLCLSPFRVKCCVGKRPLSAVWYLEMELRMTIGIAGASWVIIALDSPPPAKGTFDI